MADDSYYEDARLWSAERFETAYEQRRFAVVAEMLPPSVASVLDVGCGNGAFLAFLEATREPRLMLAGVEPSAAARSASVSTVQIHAGEAQALPFPDASFDAVVALEVLEHLRHGTFERAVGEMRRVAGQFVLVSVPYREQTDLIHCPSCGCHFHPYYHMRTFDEDVMTKLFSPMKLVTLKKIAVEDDYLGGRSLRAIYRIFGPGGEFFPTSVCPQCGLRGDEVATPRRLRAKKGLGALVKERLPRVSRTRWVVGLYTA